MEASYCIEGAKCAVSRSVLQGSSFRCYFGVLCAVASSLGVAGVCVESVLGNFLPNWRNFGGLGACTGVSRIGFGAQSACLAVSNEEK